MKREAPNYEIALALKLRGIPDKAIFLGDNSYALPTERWLNGAFAEWFSQVLVSLGIVYQEQSHDCEDFARLCAWAASHCHARTLNAPKSGLAFGELWVKDLAHAINFAVHQSADGELCLAFYEPQLDARGFACRPFPISAAQLKSVTLAKI